MALIPKVIIAPTAFLSGRIGGDRQAPVREGEGGVVYENIRK